MGLAAFCIRRPVFAVMLIAGLVGLGWNSMSRVGVDLFPRVEYPFISVATILEGATPETVETEVTDILEEGLNTISGIKTMRSTSSEGLSQIFMEFEIGEDINVKSQEQMCLKLDISLRHWSTVLLEISLLLWSE